VPVDRSLGDNVRALPGAPSSPGSPPAPGQKPSRRSRSSALVVALFALIPLLALTAGGAWYWLRNVPDARSKWVTATVTQGDVEDTITALGNLQPKDYVDVGAQVSGQLKRISVTIGQHVKAGDLLAEIDPTVLEAKVTADAAALANLQAQLVDRRAQLDLAAIQLKRQQGMMKDNATSDDALQTADTAVRSDRALIAALQAQIKESQSELDGDQANLGYTKIYAPMSGTVVSETARQGQTLNASQTAPVILRIADLATMTVWTQVSEADVSRLKLGMDAYFTTLGDQSHRWRGKLLQILPTPDVINNVVLYPALFEVANPDGRLMAQMSAQVFFVVAAVKDAVTVPIAALRSVDPGAQAGTATAPSGADGNDAKEYTVRVMDPNGRTERRQVWIGVMNRVSAEVLSGLTPGEVVVIGRQGSGGNATAGDGGGKGTRSSGSGLRRLL